MAKVVLVGDTGVGKTSIVTNFVTGQFDKFAEPTIGYVPPVKLPFVDIKDHYVFHRSFAGRHTIARS